MEHRLKVNPQDTVVFPNVDGSQADLEIQNEWEKPVMFKMKSTRPGILKMRPVFGILKPHGNVSIRLSIKCRDPSELNFNEKDRFTVVLAPIPKKLTSVSNAFKDNQCIEVRHQAVRKVLKIKLIDEKKKLHKDDDKKDKTDKKSKEEIKEDKKEEKKEEKKSKHSRRSIKNPTPDVNAVRESEDEDEEDSEPKSTCSTCSCNSDCGKSHAKTPKN
ncbi:unnamed protein product [Bursaphelenchus xylophilus]|uniref:Major sperm protein n=1 Tax=Bursaphelenchus xylophilus TaxID=6326 RepID=A0A1I7SWK4_BURXY|nr:unnamed protein product [Bursaphelenchus xylophilus]CAG9099577.1 unnamed protein product [Bursaphelenchus xylophilus]